MSTGATRVKLRQGLGLAAMSLALAAASVSALAADPALVATAPTGSGAPSTAPPSDATGSQIAAWVATNGVASDNGASQPGPDGPAPRTIHGEIDVGVGTHLGSGSGGYRNVSGVADIPVGQTGDLVVAASSTSGQVRGGRYGGYGYGSDALALGYYANGGAAPSSRCDRQLWGQPQFQAYGGLGPMDCSGSPAP